MCEFQNFCKSQKSMPFLYPKKAPGDFLKETQGYRWFSEFFLVEGRFYEKYSILRWFYVVYPFLVGKNNYE